MGRADKIKFGVTLIFRLLLIFAIGQAIYFGDWFILFVSVLTLVLMSLPSIIEHRTKIDWPSEFEIVILVFIFASMYLGEVQSFYYRFWWWDGLLHFISGLVIALLAFTLVWILNSEKRVRMKLSPGFVALFAFSFALAAGAVWEVIEFAIDYVTNNAYTLQNGLIDTMKDLILDSIGAIIVSVLGYLYLKGGLKYFKRWEKEFIDLNKDIFK